MSIVASKITADPIIGSACSGEQQRKHKTFAGRLWGESTWMLPMVLHLNVCVSKLNITGSNSGLSPGRRQAII